MIYNFLNLLLCYLLDEFLSRSDVTVLNDSIPALLEAVPPTQDEDTEDSTNVPVLPDNTDESGPRGTRSRLSSTSTIVMDD